MSYSRPHLHVRQPNRAIGGLYRSTQGDFGGAPFGIPLKTTEDAVVAAIRAGYRIADAQIERGMNVAQELRGAAKRAGTGEPNDMLTGAENLARRTFWLILEWMETAMASRESPLKRLLSAEYRMLGSLFGLNAGVWGRGAGDDPGPPPKSEPDASADATGVHVQAPSAAAHRSPVIRFEGAVTRSVAVLAWHLFCKPEALPSGDLVFRLSGRASQSFSARLDRRQTDGAPVLILRLDADTPDGHWKAALCGEDKELLGNVMIEL